MNPRALPSALDLPRPQYEGWACVWCGIPLLGIKGTVRAGRATGTMGARDMSVEVYACPNCATPETPADRVDASRGRRDDGRIPSGGEERPSR